MSFLRKLYLPLYIYFIISCELGRLVSNSIGGYATTDFRELGALIEKGVAEGRVSFSINTNANTASKAESSVQVQQPPAEKSFSERMAAKYPIYGYLDYSGYFYFLLVLWLWPAYRYNFSRKKRYSLRLERRLVNIPCFLTFLIWLTAFYDLGLDLGFHYYDEGHLSYQTVAVAIVCTFLYGSLVTYFNLGVTSRYAAKRIAMPIFETNDPYSQKRGRSINLMMRNFLLIFALAFVPMAINLYLPLAFNFYLFADFDWSGNAKPNPLVFNILIPLVIMALISCFYFLAQLSAIFSFRKSVALPIKNLVGQLARVSKGDFDCKLPVVGNDEIERLKAHFNEMLDGLAEREKLRDTFGRFVSLEIAEKIMQSGADILKGEQIEVTVMFVDIRGFTPFCEKFSPQEVVDFLNLYFSAMVGPITKEGGVVNKFIGDAVMAIFAPTFGVEAHAAAAVRAAIGLRQALITFNEQGKYPPIKIGVGCHTGPLVAGNVGTKERMEYTVIGDTVNIASRIQSQTKVFQTDILISQDTLQKIDPTLFPRVRFVDYEPVIMKGKSQPVTLYRLEQ